MFSPPIRERPLGASSRNVCVFWKTEEKVTKYGVWNCCQGCCSWRRALEGEQFRISVPKFEGPFRPWPRPSSSWATGTRLPAPEWLEATYDNPRSWKLEPRSRNPAPRVHMPHSVLGFNAECWVVVVDRDPCSALILAGQGFLESFRPSFSTRPSAYADC